MAHWYRLEKTKVYKWKHGAVDRVLHVWPCKPPAKEAFTRELTRRFLAVFGDDLLARREARACNQVADGPSMGEKSPQPKNPKAKNSRRTGRPHTGASS
jgi:hypothetical protein